MRKTVLATIAVGALALTACGSDNEASSADPGSTGDQTVVGSVADSEQLAEELDELLLSDQGISSWDEATDGWARDVVGTDVNGGTFLVHTTFDVNDGGAAADAEIIGGEVVQIVSGDATEGDIGKVTVTYSDARGAYTQRL